MVLGGRCAFRFSQEGARLFRATHTAAQKVGGELSLAADVVGDLCRVLSDHRELHHDLEPALAPFATHLSPSIVDHVLRRCSHLPLAAHRFYLWSSSPSSLHTILSILGNARLFPLAWETLHPHPDPRAFHILFRAYARAGLALDAVRAFHRMPDFGLPPSLDDLHHLLSALSRHNLPLSLNPKPLLPYNQKTYTILINAATSPADALHLFDEMLNLANLRPDLQSFNALILALCKAGELHLASTKLEEMQTLHSLHPDSASYSAFLRAACADNDVHSSLAWLDRMNRNHLAPNLYTYNTLLRLLLSNNKVDDAYNIVNEMREKGAKPDVWSYNAILAVHCRAKEVNKAMRVLSWMDRDSCPPDRHTYNMLLKMLVDIGRLDRAMEVWDGMEKRGFYPSAPSYSVMIHGLCRKNGRVEDACKFFEMMVDAGVPPYLTTCEMLKGKLMQMGLKDRARVLVSKMRMSTSCTIKELAESMEGMKIVDRREGKNVKK